MLSEGKHKYKCRQCFAKITLDIFPQPYMTVTQNEYAEKLYDMKICNRCFLEQKKLEELDKTELQFAVDRHNFLSGWRAREKYDCGYNTDK